MSDLDKALLLRDAMDDVLVDLDAKWYIQLFTYRQV